MDLRKILITTAFFTLPFLYSNTQEGFGFEKGNKKYHNLYGKECLEIDKKGQSKTTIINEDGDENAEEVTIINYKKGYTLKITKAGNVFDAFLKNMGGKEKKVPSDAKICKQYETNNEKLINFKRKNKDKITKEIQKYISKRR